MSEFYCATCKRRYRFPFDQWRTILDHHQKTCKEIRLGMSKYEGQLVERAAQIVEICPQCGCELRYPTAIHIVDCDIEGSEL